MKKLASSRLLLLSVLSIALLTVPSEILSGRSKKAVKSESVDLDSDLDTNQDSDDNAPASIKTAATNTVSVANAPTATSAFTKAKSRAIQAGNAFNMQAELQATKGQLEEVLAKVEKMINHAKNSVAGAAYEESLADDAKHPAHAGHTDVKKGTIAVIAAKKSADNLTEKAIDSVRSVRDSVAQLNKAAGDKEQELSEKMAQQAKTNQSAAMAMGVGFEKSRVDADAAASLADDSSDSSDSND